MNQQKAAPSVFISYSHDSEEHKQWVLELAQELHRQHGIKVILDQWNLKPGADISCFVDESIDESNFVLMICTETYVDKADTRKGGVGYEAMIVNSELLQNAGVNKFIPIIRQEGGDISLPKYARTRFAVDLSEGKSREEGIQKLLETLHNLPPSTKPPLGGGPLQVGAPTANTLSLSQYPSDPSRLYDAALELAQTENLPAWRRLVEKKKTDFPEALNDWRINWVRRVKEIHADPIKPNVEGLEVLGPLFAVALAGVESGMDKFNQQAGLIHDLLNPPSWVRAGRIEIVDFPETSVFVFQALLGSFAIYSGQPRLIFDLANQHVQRKHRNKVTWLWKTNELIGWSYPSEQKTGRAWSFLWDLPKHMPWVAEKISGERRFRECLCGHYFLLSFVEFIDRMHGMSHFSGEGLEQLLVPHYFITQQDEFSTGLRSILEEKQQLLEYIRSKGVVSAVLRDAWPEWIIRSEEYLRELTHPPEPARDNYKHFMEDLLT